MWMNESGVSLFLDRARCPCLYNSTSDSSPPSWKIISLSHQPVNKCLSSSYICRHGPCLSGTSNLVQNKRNAHLHAEGMPEENITSAEPGNGMSFLDPCGMAEWQNRMPGSIDRHPALGGRRKDWSLDTEERVWEKFPRMCEATHPAIYLAWVHSCWDTQDQFALSKISCSGLDGSMMQTMLPKFSVPRAFSLDSEFCSDLLELCSESEDAGSEQWAQWTLYQQ